MMETYGTITTIILSLVFRVSPILSVLIDLLTRPGRNVSHREDAIQHNTSLLGKISRSETCRSFQFRGFVAHILRQCSLACKEITRTIWRYCSNNPQFRYPSTALRHFKIFQRSTPPKWCKLIRADIYRIQKCKKGLEKDSTFYKISEKADNIVRKIENSSCSFVSSDLSFRGDWPRHSCEIQTPSGSFFLWRGSTRTGSVRKTALRPAQFKIKRINYWSF